MEHLPPWLRNVPLPRRPDAPAQGDTGADAMPDWLRELQGEVEREPAGGATPPAAADAPDWLADLERETSQQRPATPPPSATPPSRPTPTGATSWLSSLGAGQEPPSAPPEAPRQGGDQQTSTNSRVKMPVGATDWLRSIGQDPDAMSEPISEPIAGGDESGVPDWLRDLSADEVAEAVRSEPEQAPDSQPHFDPQAPGWLADDGPLPDASTVSANWAGRDTGGSGDDPDVPDWLRDVADPDEASARRDQPPPRTAEPAPANLASGVEVPAWLRDLGEPEPPAAPSELAQETSGPDWLNAPPPRQPPDWDAQDDEAEVPDWLREAEPATPPPPAPAASVRADEDEVPAWLREAEPATPPSPVPAAPVRADDEVPDWLREAEPATPPSPAPAHANDEVPAWLREVGPATTPPPAPATPVRADEDEVPAWLREAEPATSPPPATPAGDEPTWLREALAEREAGEGDDAVPAWLREAEPASAPLPPSPPARSTGNLPSWLTADESSPSPGQPPAPAGDPGLPAWLRGVADEAPSPPPPPVRAAPPPRRPGPVAEEGDSNSFLKGAELPSWLRVPEPELPTESPEGQQLDWLRRLGSAEQEEETDSVAAVAAVDRPQRLELRRTAGQLEAIALLRGLTRAPYPAPVVAPAPAAKSGLERIGLDRVLYALLALALLLGVIFPQLTAPFQSAAPMAPGAPELGALLDSLDADDVVLVAYEWAAQRSGELRPIEAAVIDRLTADRTKLILVSTDMQGTLLSFDLREPLRAAGYNVDPGGQVFGGRDYVLLGYRPGGELALRSIAQDLRGELRSDFEGRDATAGLLATNLDGSPRINGIQDLSLVLVLADQPQDVQAWMEQIHSAARDVPIAFVLPEEAQPLAQPYLRLNNVYHVAGQQGALALRASDSSGDPGALARATGLLWYSVIVFLVLLLIGAIGTALMRRSAARRRGGAA